MVDQKYLPKAAVPIWLENLRQKAKLIAPHSVKNETVFMEVVAVDEVVLDYSTTILPPKKLLLPPHEALLQFDLGTGHTQPVFDHTPTILFGVHTCDLHAMGLLDHFYGSNFPDQHYQSRRENLLLISIECLKPCLPESFCRDMNTHTAPDIYDLHLTDLGDGYSVEIGSLRGEALLDGIAEVADFNSEHQRHYERMMSLKGSRFTYRLQPSPAELPALFELSYKSTVWAQIGERCLGCGACNLVCPTCTCFNVQDEIDLTLTRGGRHRTWDSCQLDSFAVVAGGHDFRPTRADRLRHRFFHKFKYQSGTSNNAGCVGCGRCARSCMADISPMEVINTLYQRCALPAGGEKRGSNGT